MKLLITTQVVDQNDPVLGFFHRWIAEFAKHCESIEVICLYEGAHDLPGNVHVHSLGKEQAAKEGKTLSSSTYAMRFVRLMFKLRPRYDSVFVHMNPEYVVLGGIWWRLWHKRIALWYTHKSVDLKLRIAAYFANVIFTASPESFRLKSKKVHVVGHGIVLDAAANTKRNLNVQAPRMVTIGRLSPSKHLEVLIAAFDTFRAQAPASTFDIIGGAGRPEEEVYAQTLKNQISALAHKDDIALLGTKTHAEVSALLPQYDLFLHASTGTGSLDKAVLEALLAGVPVVSSSPAFRAMLEPYGLFVEENAAPAIAGAAETFLARADREAVRTALQEKVAREYSLSALIPRIISMVQ